MAKNKIDSKFKNISDSEAIEAEIVSDDMPFSEDSEMEDEFDIDIEIDPEKEVQNKNKEILELNNTKALSTTDPLSLYIAEVKKYPLLSREEEHDLAVEYTETGNSEAAERLVKANLRFVISVAAEYSKFGAKMIDLIQEGNVGLMQAVKQYNPYKGVRLITYAVWWIKGYIREYLLRHHSMVRIGTTAKQKKLYHHLRREQQKLEALGKEPDIKLLSSSLGVTEEDITDMQKRINNKDISLDQNLDSETRTQLIDLQYDPDLVLQDEALGKSELVQILNEKIELIRDSLNEKEIFILANRTLSDEPMTLQEIGDHFGISRERTRQLEARVIKKIKEEVLSDVENSEQ